MKSQTLLIGVSGGSGSGKTTFARKLQEGLGAERSAILSQDSYYIDQSSRFTGDGSVNFDHPSALDFALLADHLRALKAGSGVEVPIYDFVTHSRKPTTHRFDWKPIVVVDDRRIGEKLLTAYEFWFPFELGREARNLVFHH